MTRHIKNWEDLPPKLMPDGVERILQLVRPAEGDADRCRHDVAFAIRMIAALPPFVPPGTIRKLLEDITAKLQAVRTAIDELPHGWRMVLRAEEGLDRVIKKSEELVASISVPKRSGGAPDTRRLTIQKHLAAEQALDLMSDYARGRSLTSMKNGEYCRIAALLLEMATARRRQAAGEGGRRTERRQRP